MCLGYRFWLAIRGLKLFKFWFAFAESLMLYQQRKPSYARLGTVCKKDTEFQTEIQSHLVVDGFKFCDFFGADWGSFTVR